MSDSHDMEHMRSMIMPKLYSDGLLSDEELARVAFDSDEEAGKREKTPTKNVPPVQLSQPKATATAPKEEVDFSVRGPL